MWLPVKACHSYILEKIRTQMSVNLFFPLIFSAVILYSNRSAVQSWCSGTSVTLKDIFMVGLWRLACIRLLSTVYNHGCQVKCACACLANLDVPNRPVNEREWMKSITSGYLILWTGCWVSPMKGCSFTWKSGWQPWRKRYCDISFCYAVFQWWRIIFLKTLMRLECRES